MTWHGSSFLTKNGYKRPPTTGSRRPRSKLRCTVDHTATSALVPVAKVSNAAGAVSASRKRAAEHAGKVAEAQLNRRGRR